MRRIGLAIILTVGLILSPRIAETQPTGKIWRIGYPSPEAAPTDSPVLAFRKGLQELGYIEGKNLLIEYRYAQGALARLPELAADLVRLKVDVVVTYSTPAIQAAQDATRTIPIIMAAVADPVALNPVASLAHPGGNVRA